MGHCIASYRVKMLFKLACVLLLASTVSQALQLPPEIHKCSKSDPKLSQCMGKSMIETLKYFKNGNKEFGFPSFEPFYVEKLEIEAEPGKSVSLNQKYEHVVLNGMTDAEVRDFRMVDDGTICKWEMLIYTKRTVMHADYTLTGQVLVFPLNGHGKCNVTLSGILNKHVAECEHYVKKGKSHLRMKNYSISMSVEECHFDFPNIIPDNEQISKELGKTLNENSLEVFEDVKAGFEKILADLHQNGANSVFSRVPEEDLFLP